MLYITAMIKTDFHSYFYRTVVLKKGTNNPLLDTALLNCQTDVEHFKKEIKEYQSTTPSYLRRQGLGVKEFE